VTGFGLSLSFDRDRDLERDFDLPGLAISHLPSCLPSLRRFMLPGFIATMKTLTAVGVASVNEIASAVRSGRSRCGSYGQGFVIQSPQLNRVHSLHVLATNSSPCLSRLTFRPFRLQPPYFHFPHDRFSTLLHRHGLPRLPLMETQGAEEKIRRAVKGSHIASRLPDRLGRSEFTLLRTGRSLPGCSPPPLAGTQLHFQFQAGNVRLEGTFTLLIKRLHRRTSCCRQAASS
jgi:hypothetical protein